MTSISVVIPTCDRLDFLKETVQCVLGQSRPADEIIVVNNGKSHLPQGYLSENIKVLELSPYVGVSRARNEGVAFASGDYVAFQDDDDLWEKDYLQKVSALIKQEQPDCIISRQDKLFHNKVIPYKNSSGKLKLPILFRTNPGIGGQTTIISKNAFLEIGGYDINLKTGEDKSLVIDFLLKGFKVTSAPHIQSIIRVHDNPRLTDSEHMAKGITAFLQKYEDYMTLSQKNYNWLKVYRHRYKTHGGVLTFLKFQVRLLLDHCFRALNH